jgi:hypothetical protein
MVKTVAGLIPHEGMVACEVCLTEIPASEATSSEAVDYVHYFCGAGCHERWQQQAGMKPAEPGRKAPA